MIDYIVCWLRSGRGRPARFDGRPAEQMQWDRAGESSIEKEFLTECEPVLGFNRSLRELIIDLTDTLLARPEGIGLAAPQVNDHRRVVVVRLGSECQEGGEAGPLVPIINPAILEARDEREDFDGCLSFPGLFGETIRPHYLRLAGLNGKGRPLDRVFEGFDAVVVHHEIDHLDGVLFIDRIERQEDLFRVLVDINGRRVRIPLSAALSEGPDRV